MLSYFNSIQNYMEKFKTFRKKLKCIQERNQFMRKDIFGAFGWDEK